MSGDELGRLRSLLGRSTRLWAGDGEVEVETDGWTALSGVPAVDFNVVLCHGADSVARGLEKFKEIGVPGLLMLAGPALAEAGILVENSWVCIDSVPVMTKTLGEVAVARKPSSAVVERRLDPEDLESARALIVSAFGMPDEFGRVALPDRAAGEDSIDVWGSFDPDEELLSTLILVREEDAVVPWSMASAAAARGSGHGSRLLDAALAAATGTGAEMAVLQSASSAVGFYRRSGFAERETWQVWSRPRWVLGRG